MSRKPILIVKDDPESKSAVDMICSIRNDCEAAVRSIKTEAEAAIERIQKQALQDCEPHWRSLLSRLETLGKLTPGRENPPLSINQAEGIVYEMDSEECDCATCQGRRGGEVKVTMAKLPKEVEETLRSVFSLLSNENDSEDDSEQKSASFGQSKSNLFH